MYIYSWRNGRLFGNPFGKLIFVDPISSPVPWSLALIRCEPFRIDIQLSDLLFLLAYLFFFFFLSKQRRKKAKKSLGLSGKPRLISPSEGEFRR